MKSNLIKPDIEHISSQRPTQARRQENAPGPPRRSFAVWCLRASFPLGYSGFSALGGVFIPLNQFAAFATVTAMRFSASRFPISARCSSVSSRFAIYGLWPSRYGQRAQRSTVHSFTSLELPQQQSRHFARMALMGVNFFSSIVFSPFLCLPATRLFFAVAGRGGISYLRC